MLKFCKIHKSNISIIVFVLMLSLLPFILFATDSDTDDTVTKVICNIINFVQKLGLPIMTGVILGSSVMAIFGRLAWPAIVVLVVFTAIFFGAGKLISKFAAGITAGGQAGESFDCSEYVSD